MKTQLKCKKCGTKGYIYYMPTSLAGGPIVSYSDNIKLKINKNYVVSQYCKKCGKPMEE